MRKSQQGFGLIEVLISMVILSFGLIATTRMQLNLAQGTALARQRLEATDLARSKMEEFKGKAACVAVAAYDVPASIQTSTSYSLSATCVDAKTPTVVVSWTTQKSSQSKVVAANGSLTADNRVQLTTSL